MPSGPRKRKSARRKTEAAKGQGQQQQESPHSITLSEKDASLCGSPEEQDGFSSPRPCIHTPPKDSRIFSSEAKDERLSNTEEWVRVSNFGVHPYRGKIESHEASSEDPDMISPSISVPSDKLVDWETISNSSFPENSQYAETSESGSKPKLTFGNGHLLDDMNAHIFHLKPSDDDYINCRRDSTMVLEPGFKGDEQNSMEENYTDLISKKIIGFASTCHDDFDPAYNINTVPSFNVEELKLKEHHTSWETDIIGKPKLEKSSDVLDNDKGKTLPTSLSDDQSTADLELFAPKIDIAVCKDQEIAVTPSKEEDAEQDIYKPEVVDIEGNRETALLNALVETSAANKGMIDAEEYAREDSGLPGSAGIMDKEASLGWSGDASQKSIQKLTKTSDVLKFDAENSSLEPKSTGDIVEEGSSKSQVCEEVENYQPESLDGDLTPKKDNDPGKPSFSNLGHKIVSAIDADAHEFTGNSAQQLEWHNIEEPPLPGTKEVKTKEIHLEDKTFESPGSHNNQVVEKGPHDHKMVTSWKGCCGVFDWLFAWSP